MNYPNNVFEPEDKVMIFLRGQMVEYTTYYKLGEN
jgi:hypothetical protein